MTNWIWLNEKWPQFTFDINELSSKLVSARKAQGRLLGMLHTIGHDVTQQMNSIILSNQAIDTSAIEGEHLNRDSVRSSIAERLGLDRAGISSPPDRYVEGLLDMLLDATGSFNQPLTLERLYGWHAALFPSGYSGIKKIIVAGLREQGPMQIVSGMPNKQEIHYEAPPSNNLAKEMDLFLNWFNNDKTKDGIDGILRAGLAHLWFELVHPFDDGNGRLGRAIIDLALAQDEQLECRYYSLSSAIMCDRKNYYATLAKCCRGDMDITSWLLWFLNCVEKSILKSIRTIDSISFKSHFWQKHATTEINSRQIKVLNRLLNAGRDGFIGGMTTRKYTQLTKASRATAYRELKDLVVKRCLRAITEKGRSAAYEINWEET